MIRHRQKGQGLTEFALILPIVLLVLLGIIEAARVIWAYITIQNAAREAARYAVTGQPYNEAGDPWSMDDDVRVAAIKQRALDAASALPRDYVAGDGDTALGQSDDYDAWAPEYVSGLNSPSTLGVAVSGQRTPEDGKLTVNHPGLKGLYVQVEVYYNIVMFDPLFNVIMGGRHIPLRGKAVLQNEGINQALGGELPMFVPPQDPSNTGGGNQGTTALIEVRRDGTAVAEVPAGSTVELYLSGHLANRQYYVCFRGSPISGTPYTIGGDGSALIPAYDIPLSTPGGQQTFTSHLDDPTCSSASLAGSQTVVIIGAVTPSIAITDGSHNPHAWPDNSLVTVFLALHDPNTTYTVNFDGAPMPTNLGGPCQITTDAARTGSAECVIPNGKPAGVYMMSTSVATTTVEVRTPSLSIDSGTGTIWYDNTTINLVLRNHAPLHSYPIYFGTVEIQGSPAVVDVDGEKVLSYHIPGGTSGTFTLQTQDRNTPLPPSVARQIASTVITVTRPTKGVPLILVDGGDRHPAGKVIKIHLREHSPNANYALKFDTLDVDGDLGTAGLQPSKTDANGDAFDISFKIPVDMQGEKVITSFLQGGGNYSATYRLTVLPVPYITIAGGDRHAPGETITIQLRNHAANNAYDVYLDGQLIRAGVVVDNNGRKDISYTIPTDITPLGTEIENAHPIVSRQNGEQAAATNLFVVAADLQVTAINPPVSPQPGLDLPIALTIQNNSAITLTGFPFDNDLYVDPNPVPDYTRTFPPGDDKVWINSIGPNQSMVITPYVQIYNMGTYNLYGRTDTSNRVIEGALENNNILNTTMVLTCTVTPYTDLFSDGVVRSAGWSVQTFGDATTAEASLDSPMPADMWAMRSPGDPAAMILAASPGLPVVQAPPVSLAAPGQPARTAGGAYRVEPAVLKPAAPPAPAQVVTEIMVPVAAAAAIPLAADSGTLGPNGNAADTTTGDGNGFQTNANYAYTNDGNYAQNSNNGTNSSHTDAHFYYNFSIPTIPAGSTINGIEVFLDRYRSNDTGTSSIDVTLSWDGDAGTPPWTSARTDSSVPTSAATLTLGGTADNWGRTWSPGDFTNANFRVRIATTSSNTSMDFFLDWVGVRVTYTLPPDSVAPTSTATVALTQTNTSPIAVTWSGSDNSGGSGMGVTELWYKLESGGTWTNSSLTSTSGATSGTFNFPPPGSTNGVYYFKTIARDLAGNYELPRPPTGNGNDSIIYDTIAPATTASSPASATAPFQVSASTTETGVGMKNVSLYYRGPGAASWTLFNTLSGAGPFSWTFTPTGGNGTYAFRSYGCDVLNNCEVLNAGDSPDSQTVYAALAAPTTLAATATTTNNVTTVRLTWQDASADETGFRIERSPDGANGWTQVGSVAANVTEFTDTQVTCSSTYYYRVVAYRTSDGGASASTTASVTTAECPPSISCTASREVGGTLTLCSSGSSATQANDGAAGSGYVFMYRSVNSRTFDMYVRLVSVPARNPGSLAGLEVRNGLGATDAKVNLLITNANLQQVVATRRPANGAIGQVAAADAGGPVPTWLRIVRGNGNFYFYYNTDAAEQAPTLGAWTLLGQTADTMNASVVVGLVNASGEGPTKAASTWRNFSLGCLNVGTATCGIVSEDDGTVVVNALNYTDKFPAKGAADQWLAGSAYMSYSGASYTTADYYTKAPMLEYSVNIEQAGTYYVWVFGNRPSTSSDSVHVGLDGKPVSTADKMQPTTSGSGLIWFTDTADGPQATLNLTQGIHTINVWGREPGFQLMQLILTNKPKGTTSGRFTPSGTTLYPQSACLLPVPPELPPNLSQCNQLIQNTSFEDGSLLWSIPAQETTRLASGFPYPQPGTSMSVEMQAYLFAGRHTRPYLSQNAQMPAWINNQTTTAMLKLYKAVYKLQNWDFLGYESPNDHLYFQLRDAAGQPLTSDIPIATGADNTNDGRPNIDPVNPGGGKPARAADDWVLVQRDIMDYLLVDPQQLAGRSVQAYFFAPNPGATNPSDPNRYSTTFYVDAVTLDVCTTQPQPDKEAGKSALAGQVVVFVNGTLRRIQGVQLWAYRIDGEMKTTYSVNTQPGVNNYGFYNLEPGTYILYAQFISSSGTPYGASTSVTVAADKTVQQNLVLIPE